MSLIVIMTVFQLNVKECWKSYFIETRGIFLLRYVNSLVKKEATDCSKPKFRFNINKAANLSHEQMFISLRYFQLKSTRYLTIEAISHLQYHQRQTFLVAPYDSCLKHNTRFLYCDIVTDIDHVSFNFAYFAKFYNNL